jgi:hypothetical protein
VTASPESWDSWEDVLAAVEADADHSAAVVASAGDLDAVLPDPMPLVLPPLAAMPPVPDHLRERVTRLRDRIRQLEVELAATLREWQVPSRPAPLVPVAAPRLLDRRV